MPGINFPDGYSAQVDGAAVTSRDDAPVLRLRRELGADQVSVLVRP